MTYDFSMKRNDTSPSISYQLLDEDSNPIDITGFNEVRFIMAEIGDDPAIDADTTTGVNVPDAANGVVEYQWQTSDTDTLGTFRAEFEVEYSDATKETFPNTDFIRVYIYEDLG